VLPKTRKKLADGTVRNYWYAWRGGPRLEGSPGTAEFVASYNTAVAARQRPNNSLLSSVLDAYQDAEAFRCLASKTKKDYKRILHLIGEKFGDCPIKLLEDRRVRGERAGEGLTFHDLRGTAVSRLASAGATEMEIAAITGHAVNDVRSIMDKFYFNRDPAMAVSAVQKLEQGTKSANRPANQPE
jgi:integrase